MSTSGTIWPKNLGRVSEEQRRISDDFMKYWHEVLPKKYSVIDKFNHSYPVRASAGAFSRGTLEIGAGIGEHLQYEQLTPEQEQGYYALELRENMSRCIRERFARVQVVTGDCQKRLDFEDGYFDRILAIHVLEHLPNLPAAVQEAYRVCDKRKGRLARGHPLRGKPGLHDGARFRPSEFSRSADGQPYKWFIEREHLNRPREILNELAGYFTVVHRAFFPIPVPLIFCNLVIGLTLEPKER